MRIGARHHHITRLDGLAQGFQHGARIFGEFIQKQHTVMGQADFARLGAPPTADDRGHRGRVMRRAKGARARDAAIIQKPCQRMDHRGFKRLGCGKRGQDTRQARGEHGFPRPRRAHHQQMMPPCGGDFHRTFGAFLAAHFGQAFGMICRDDLAGAGGLHRGAFGQMGDQPR